MAVRRVIAYYMRDSEQIAALAAVQEVGHTQSYVLGDIEEGDIPALREQGVVVQILSEEPPEVETPGRAGATLANFAISSGTAVRATAAPDDTANIDLAGPNYYVVQLAGPLLPTWRSALRQIDVTLLDRLLGDAYTARLTFQQVAALRARTDMVRGVRRYTAQDTESPEDHPQAQALTRSATTGTAPRQMLAYDARVHRPEDLESLRAWLNSSAIPVAGEGRRKIRIYLLEGSAQKEALAGRPEVASLEPYIEPTSSNDVARQIIGIEAAPPASALQILETGANQIVGIADTGIDEHHPDFAGRLDGFSARGRTGLWNDPDGHGTHVAGSVAGSGAAIKGAAPEAHIYFQSLLDANGGLGGLPVDLYDLFDEAYNFGARIHNNSWGSKTGSSYPTSSLEVDEFVADKRDMLIVIAAGNDGTAANPQNSAAGFPDWLSISSPASAKNALTVGASRSSRTTGGYSGITWNTGWPAKFPQDPIASQKVSGDPESLAGFSSRGPCNDHRIKPDVVAPGTDIVSTKSTLAPLTHFWGAYTDPKYAYMGGTSMAAPLVAGCAALAREFYENLGHEPSAALLKATLINGTRWLSGVDSAAPTPGKPNFHQGHGCIHMPSAIPNPSQPNLSLLFIDSWKTPAQQLNDGERLQWVVNVNGGTPLRICMTYTDLPGRALQNDLDLMVRLPPDAAGNQGATVLGNEGVPLGLAGPDSLNNVESVRIDNPATGNYLIQVFAHTLLRGPQDFALVVTGDLEGNLVQI